MSFDLNKYKYALYTDKDGKQVISARSTYAGKTVKGYAKCDPRDAYDVESGKRLAAARCNARVANKRTDRAKAKVDEAMKQLVAAQKHLAKMQNYYSDALAESTVADKEVTELLKNM
jgi:hypothetical protein